MIREITQDVLWPGLIVLCAIVLSEYSIIMGYLPTP